MATPIPTYNSVADIYAAVETNWPDNNTRAITELKLRTVVDGIVDYFARTTTGKPEILSFITGQDMTIDLTTDRINKYGQIPQITILVDNGNGYLESSDWVWHVDQPPPNTTQIIVPNPNVEGLVILG